MQKFKRIYLVFFSVSPVNKWNKTSTLVREFLTLTITRIRDLNANVIILSFHDIDKPEECTLNIVTTAHA